MMKKFCGIESLETRQLMAGTASISGFVFNDLDADGKKDANEVNIPSVKIYLDINNNQKLDATEKNTLTNSQGKYTLSALNAGTYKVRQITPAGMVQTIPTQGFGYNVTLAAAQVVTNKFFGAVGVATAIWGGFARNAQHTGISDYASNNLDRLRWSTVIDQQPEFTGDSLYAHYGSPVITKNNTVIVPVKTELVGGFKLEARRGSDGAVLWSKSSDYILPPHYWTPTYQPTVTPAGRVYFAGKGGTVYWRDNLDKSTGNSGQIAFYGMTKYQSNKAAMDASVFINTPITADASGNVYFGIQVVGSNPAGLKGGIVRIDVNGTGTFMSAATATGDANAAKVVQNCAPALSNDGKIVYVGMNNTSGVQAAYLVALDAKTLQTINKVKLLDPKTQTTASLNDNGTASPTIGPDGDVYYGVLDVGQSNRYRGYMLHFSGDLKTKKTPGSYGWDTTSSIVPSTMVPSYTGTSKYLIMTKSNDYISVGGSGIHKLLILDPSATQTDSITGITVMKEVLTVDAPTPDDEHPEVPGAVTEWCVNNAAVDPKTFSILVNSEDGSLYRWDLRSNSLTQSIALTGGIGEAYTSTLIGPDGTVYAINKGILWAVGK